jgi:hypothetical protein
VYWKLATRERLAAESLSARTDPWPEYEDLEVDVTRRGVRWWDATIRSAGSVAPGTPVAIEATTTDDIARDA